MDVIRRLYFGAERACGAIVWGMGSECCGGGYTLIMLLGWRNLPWSLRWIRIAGMVATVTLLVLEWTLADRDWASGCGTLALLSIFATGAVEYWVGQRIEARRPHASANDPRAP